MAAELLKLKVTATADNTTTAKPTPIRYFYTINGDHLSGTTLTIPAASFVDDTGTAYTAITPAATNNGYSQVFINGQLQEGGLYTVSTTNLVVTDISADEVGKPLALIVTNFDPETTSTITVNI